jgi:hypothetical protein
MCKNLALGLDFKVVGTSPEFFAPRGRQRQPIGKLRNDRRMGAAHIVPPYPALAESDKIIRQTYVILRKQKFA